MSESVSFFCERKEKGEMVLVFKFFSGEFDPSNGCL
jgi:hypothetical protein